MDRVALIFGTRPEAIKLCPLVAALRQMGIFEVDVCVTGQHREMLKPVLRLFDVRPQADLSVMTPNQTLATLTSRLLAALEVYLAEHKPKLVVVQGDTTTALCASLSAFYQRIRVAHVEAGLRTWNRFSPYPEEVNRSIITRIADYHFAPTTWARDNLLRDGVDPGQIFVTGNTVIDALRVATSHIREHPPTIPGLSDLISPNQPSRRLVLITAHRRENFGPGFESICRAIALLSTMFKEVSFVFPVHLNPNVREPVYRLLGALPNVLLIDPLGYLEFVALMDRAVLVLTDSGGVQEEAPSLGKPVLVMRDTTERPEAVEAGIVQLVGANAASIVEGVSHLLTDAEAFASMSRASNPYGDGFAAQRIARTLEAVL